MNEIEIIEAENPKRYGFILGKNIILCQAENDNHTLSVVKSRNGKRPAYKAYVLYKGDAQDFCKKYLKCGQIGIKRAFENFLTELIINL